MIAAIVAIFCTSLVCAKKHYSERAVRNLPKAKTLTQKDLEAHIVNLTPMSELKDLKSKKLDGAMSEWTEFEFAYSGESKGSLFVYDSPGDDEAKYIVMMIKRCASGPPLLPIECNGTLTWVEYEGDFHFAKYLQMALARLKGDDWSRLILTDLNDQRLSWYQAAVAEENWRLVWDALLKPFSEQRSAYRGVHKTRHAPEIFFGVEAKFHDWESSCAESSVSRPRLPSSISTSNDLPQTSSPLATEDEISGYKGIEIPTAADWFEFWGSQPMPRERTFIHFANALSDASFPRRTMSFPDIREIYQV
jgi:hypothetical protein